MSMNSSQDPHPKRGTKRASAKRTKITMNNLFKLIAIALIISGQSLFASVAVARVPDAGSTAPLLGLAIGGLVMARNTLRRKK